MGVDERGKSNNKQVHKKNRQSYAVTIDITGRCQMRCITCSKWKTPAAASKKEIDTQGWKKAIVKLKKQANCTFIVFSGGEPFLRSDIFELIDFAESHGIRTSAVSNGYLLFDMAEKIIQSRLSSLVVSLNSFKPAIHDFTRGVKGSFVRAKEALLKINRLRRNRDKRLVLAVETVLMPSPKANYITHLIDWVKRKKLDGVFFQLLNDKKSFRSFYKSKALSIAEFKHTSSKIIFNMSERKMLIRLIERIIKKKNRGYPVLSPDLVFEIYRLFLYRPKDIGDLVRCKAGERNFFIDPYGDIRLCCSMSPIGSIKTMSLYRVLNSAQALRQRAVIKKCKKFCKMLLCNL